MAKKSHKTTKIMKPQNPQPGLEAAANCTKKANTLQNLPNPPKTSQQTLPMTKTSQSIRKVPVSQSTHTRMPPLMENTPTRTPPTPQMTRLRNSSSPQKTIRKKSPDLQQKQAPKLPIEPHPSPKKPNILLGKNPTDSQIVSYCVGLTNQTMDLKKEGNSLIVNEKLPCGSTLTKEPAKKKNAVDDALTRVENHVSFLHKQIQNNLKEIPKLNTGINTDPVLGCRKIVLNSSSSARSSIISGRNRSPMRARTPLHSYASFQNEPIFNYQLYKQFKEVTDVAMKFRKTFMIYGRFPTVRRALKSRGWVEKLPKNSHENLMRLTTNELLRRMELNDCEHELCEAVIVTKMLGTRLPDFIWNNSTKGADRETFEKFQICSRMRHAAPGDFTLKYALTRCLHDFQWFWIQDESDVNFPRCYTVINPEQYKLFEDDFLTTACVSLLEFIEFRTKSELCGELGKIPLDIIEFACNHCKEFIRKRLNVDIDEADTDKEDNTQRFPTSQDINDFLYCYYQIVQTGKQFELDEKHELENYKNNASSIYRAIRKFLPQHFIDGVNNIWLLKPGNLSRGRGITIMQKLDEIQDLVRKNPKRYVIQKYVERPLLIYNTKFDIRQFFLLTCTSPLTVWMYKDCYLRFSSRQYNTRNFHPSIHLTNNAIQCQYKNEPNRDQNLPQENMWHSSTFKQYLSDNGCPNAWEKLIYPGMKKNIIGTLLCCQEFLDRRTNSFELYGVDFMIAEDFKPWLIEINSGPDLSSSTSITAKLCHQAIEDVIKVVIDHGRNVQASTGRFECVYRQQIPSYAPGLKAGEDLYIEGKALPANYFYKFNTKQARLFPSFTRILELDEHRNMQNGKNDEVMPYIRKRQEALLKKFEDSTLVNNDSSKTTTVKTTTVKTSTKKMKRLKMGKEDELRKREKREDKHVEKKIDKKHEEIKALSLEFKPVNETPENKSSANESKIASTEKKKNSENQVIKEMGAVLQVRLQTLKEKIIETKLKMCIKKKKIADNQQVNTEIDGNQNSTENANSLSKFNWEKEKNVDIMNTLSQSNEDNQIEKRDLVKGDEVLTEKLLKTTINETVKISSEILGQGSNDSKKIVQAFKNYENSENILENNSNKIEQVATNNTNSSTSDELIDYGLNVSFKVDTQLFNNGRNEDNLLESIRNVDQQQSSIVTVQESFNKYIHFVEPINDTCTCTCNTSAHVLKQSHNYKQSNNETQSKIEENVELEIKESDTTIEKETPNNNDESNVLQKNDSLLKTTHILDNLNNMLHKINKHIDDECDTNVDDKIAKSQIKEIVEEVGNIDIAPNQIICYNLINENDPMILKDVISFEKIPKASFLIPQAPEKDPVVILTTIPSAELAESQTSSVSELINFTTDEDTTTEDSTCYSSESNINIESDDIVDNNDDSYERISNKVLSDNGKCFERNTSTETESTSTLSELSSRASSIQRNRASKKKHYRSPNYVRGNGHGMITSKARYDTDNYFKHSNHYYTSQKTDLTENPETSDFKGGTKRTFKLQAEQFLNCLTMNLISCTPLQSFVNSFDFRNPVPKRHHPKHKTTLYLTRKAYPKEVNTMIHQSKILKDIIKTEQTISDMKAKSYAAKLNGNKPYNKSLQKKTKQVNLSGHKQSEKSESPGRKSVLNKNKIDIAMNVTNQPDQSKKPKNFTTKKRSR